MIYPVLAEIPEWLPLFSLACVGFALVALFGLLLLLRGMRELRSGVTEEVRRELAAGKEAAPVAVQQPLVVKPHEVQPTAAELHQVREEFSELREQRRKDVHGLHIKIETGLAQVGEAQTRAREDIAVLKNEATNTARQIHQLDSKIEDLPEKILRIMDRNKS